MGKYYDFFSKSAASHKPVFSVPYIDAFGIGMPLVQFASFTVISGLNSSVFKLRRLNQHRLYYLDVKEKPISQVSDRN